MLNVDDLMDRYEVPRITIANWYARKILPAAIRIGCEHYWREEDITLFEDFLERRKMCEEEGRDPNAPDGPEPPVYLSGCEVMDPRKVVARLAERERQSKSKTLAAGSQSTPVESPVELPTLKNQEQKK